MWHHILVSGYRNHYIMKILHKNIPLNIKLSLCNEFIWEDHAGLSFVSGIDSLNLQISIFKT